MLSLDAILELGKMETDPADPFGDTHTHTHTHIYRSLRTSGSREV